ncbi:MAG: PadR family transcriptional regulator [Acidobacteria bacterium]|nr:PadR family transcriptional regulator [Acidobacteriota bacterium]
MSNANRLVQGTLDMLILRTLVFGPAHGHAVAKHIQRTSDEVLQVETGSLYPALRRLEQDGLIEANWAKSKERNRELRFYSLTAKGRDHLRAESSKWKELFDGVARVMWPAEESEA